MGRTKDREERKTGKNGRQGKTETLKIKFQVSSFTKKILVQELKVKAKPGGCKKSIGSSDSSELGVPSPPVGEG